MLDALVAGTTDPEVLADLARGQLRSKLPALREALEGRFDELHALLIGAVLAHLDFLDEQIERLTEMIGAQIAPFEKADTDDLLHHVLGLVSGVGQSDPHGALGARSPVGLPRATARAGLGTGDRRRWAQRPFAPRRLPSWAVATGGGAPESGGSKAR